ncbi:SAM-dependent methyltransferase [Marinicauda algicola]|uniref:SAM-dependent methyltransferase n=1 Tax=Marinicauda algicola TaxID=2029849 RepID=A0A4V3RYG3_9PROT|nr:class I SAM-dependent methyltransferase [Marinicauda algicola]TGY90309.1 SAM-dependent methyltransferase [Marinicauda algicola]
MKECSKFVLRRSNDKKFACKYLVGDGVDIGGEPDPLALYRTVFPLITSVKTWDLGDGDAQFMAGVEDGRYDFVFSSHCLEHLRDPFEGLKNWLRVVKPGGHIVFMIPEEDMYERGVWPSTHNRDHKRTFTVFKEKSWSPDTTNVLDLVKSLGAYADLRHLQVIDQTYHQDWPRYDQTLTPVTEAAIEVVIRKRTDEEVQAGGRHLTQSEQPSPFVRRYLNQYKADHEVLKRHTDKDKLFSDESEV